MRLIDADKLTESYLNHCRTEFEITNCCMANENVLAIIQNAPTIERPQGEWNNHTVACLLADLFGDPCACNVCGIDEWLPKKCDFANKECPDVVGVACWEQFLKYREEMRNE